MDVKEFEQLSKSNALLFISRLYNAPSIPRNHVQLILDITHSLMYAGLSDYETGNALGSNAGVHEVGATYVSIPCFPTEYQATLSSIFIALLFYSSDRKEFGNTATFYKVIDELKFLQETGNELDLPEGKVTLYFQLGSLLADNLGMHQLLGYIESFQGNYACKFCKMHFHERSKCCVSDLSLLRNPVTYEADLLKNDFSLTGIKEKSAFSELPGFHVTQNVSVDFMHDGPEGFLSFDMLEIIKHYSSKTINLFTLEQLDNIIVAYDFGERPANRFIGGGKARDLSAP